VSSTAWGGRATGMSHPSSMLLGMDIEREHEPSTPPTGPPTSRYP
jgi:hypothetical protein